MPATAGVVPWLETGIHGRTGWPIAPVRAGLELSALTAGFLLGGTAGVGTLAFAWVWDRRWRWGWRCCRPRAHRRRPAGAGETAAG